MGVSFLKVFLAEMRKGERTYTASDADQGDDTEIDQRMGSKTG
jgi:hypothetical protein